jgi:hypothetical protein
MQPRRMTRAYYGSRHCRPCVTARVAKKGARDRTNRNHTQKKNGESTTGLKEAKGLIPGSSATRTKDLLKLNRDQLRWVVWLFTGHCHLKWHLFKLGLTDDLTCERCQKKTYQPHMYVCMYKGWAIKLALAPRSLLIYCASPLTAAMIITVAALSIVLAHGSKPT